MSPKKSTYASSPVKFTWVWPPLLVGLALFVYVAWSLYTALSDLPGILNGFYGSLVTTWSQLLPQQQTEFVATFTVGPLFLLFGVIALMVHQGRHPVLGGALTLAGAVTAFYLPYAVYGYGWTYPALFVYLVFYALIVFAYIALTVVNKWW